MSATESGRLTIGHKTKSVTAMMELVKAKVSRAKAKKGNASSSSQDPIDAMLNAERETHRLATCLNFRRASR